MQDVFGQLKMEPMRARDGKLRETECATRPVMLRLVQSIPSKQAETVRLWLAQIGEEKLQEAEQHTQVDQLRSYYISRGRTPEWADAWIRNLIGRNLLTDEWLQRGAQQHLHFGLLTKTIHEGTFGIAPSTHHHVIKQLPKGVKHPRDHYMDIELNVLALSEAAARTLHQRNNSQGVPRLLKDAQAAGEFGGQVREQFEQLTNERVVSSQNFLDQPKGKQQQLPQARQDSLFEQPGEEDRLRERDTTRSERMAETDHLWAEGLRILGGELADLRASSLKLNSEPDFREVADPPGKALIQAYLSALHRRQPFTATYWLVFYAEVPPPPRNERSAWFVKSLLQQWGDPAWDAQESAWEKEHRLEATLQEAHVELVIVADIHHLVLPRQVLRERLDWLLSLFQTGIHVPLVIVGEPAHMQQLILSDARFCSRFWPIRLPGEQKLPEDPTTRACLYELLGLGPPPDEQEGVPEERGSAT